MTENVTKSKSYDFAVRIIRFSRELQNEKHFEIASQLLRSGTSIGANVEEASAGQSRRDFFAKMAISSKEARETNYWLRLIRDAELVSLDRVQPLLDDSYELVKILCSIVKTGTTEK
ncbi:MAG: four helix bundle protein [Phycisphaerae bacterium]|nr:four helix bundle protein [Phycisphaerae bacterium]